MKNSRSNVLTSTISDDIIMVNSWSLLYDELNMEHSNYYYEYDRNDPNRKKPEGMEVKADGWSTSEDGIIGSVGEDKITFNLELPQIPDNNNGRWKYDEDVILKDIHEYVSGTYRSHYTGKASGFRFKGTQNYAVQTIDLLAAKDLASDFCQANIIKYGSRYGDKDGKNKKDLLKVIHYAMLLLHFDDHYKSTNSDFPY